MRAILTKLQRVPAVKIWLFGLALGLASFWLVLPKVWASSGEAATESAPENKASITRLVTIYDRGQKRVVMTNKTVVGEVLAQAKIELNRFDVTEPSAEVAIDSDEFNINIFRAQPVVIIDGNRRIQTQISHQDPRLAVQSSGVTLFAEDVVETKLDLLASGAGHVNYLVRRAKAINVLYYGKIMELRTQSRTVAELLQEKSLQLTAEDHLNVDLDTVLTNGLSFELWREGKQEITAEETIAFTTRKVMDFNRDSSYRHIEKPGQNGTKVVTYEIEIKNGVEIGRKAINSIVTLEPVEQVEVVGAKIDLPAGSHQDWIAQAGIAAADFGYVEYIISKESGWGVTKWNRAGSGAYGLCQALPATKMRSAGEDYMTNPITQLRWCSSYATSRYGSWANAYQFWTKNKWW